MAILLNRFGWADVNADFPCIYRILGLLTKTIMGVQKDQIELYQCKAELQSNGFSYFYNNYISDKQQSQFEMTSWDINDMHLKLKQNKIDWKTVNEPISQKLKHIKTLATLIDKNSERKTFTEQKNEDPVRYLVNDPSVQIIMAYVQQNAVISFCQEGKIILEFTESIDQKLTREQELDAQFKLRQLVNIILGGVVPPIILCKLGITPKKTQDEKQIVYIGELKFYPGVTKKKIKIPQIVINRIAPYIQQVYTRHTYERAKVGRLSYDMVVKLAEDERLKLYVCDEHIDLCEETFMQTL